MRLKFSMFPLAFWGFFLLSACAVTGQDGQRMTLRSDEFADYVETIFRRQNGLATELRLELDDAEPDSQRYRLLDRAEQDLQTACQSLNQLAAERRDGGQPRGIRAFKRARQAPDCERAAAAVAELL